MKKIEILCAIIAAVATLFPSIAVANTPASGCLVCHKGIEKIVDGAMYDALISFSEKEEYGYTCPICHEGNPNSKDKQEAHKGMYQNPGNMWVVSKGKGCGKCHSKENALSTLMKKPLPKPVGGSYMSVESDVSDPSGATGKNHVYRMQRALMALETGKANKTLSSNGVIKKGTFPYANFDMDDPDGEIPCVGSDAYKEWIKKAIDSGFIKRLKGTKEIPAYDKGVKIFKSPSKAAYADMHRKQCARCHVWGEGRGKRGEHRAGGCAACHVIYNNDGVYEGGDPLISGKGVHMIKHRITLNIPSQQCAHCHTRGKRIGTTYTGLFEYDYKGDGAAPPWDKKGNPQKKLFTKEYLNVRKDIHLERGMHCVDCHTSIDVHGDGNIYPVTFFQVEIGCTDCHGTPLRYPWELPVGFGTKVLLDGKRGTFKKAGVEYMITTRGNARANWIKEGDSAYLLAKISGKKMKIPLLKSITMKDSFKTPQGKTAMALIPQHIEKMECYTCHSIWAPQCFGCHIKYDMRKKGTDWVLTSKNRDKQTGKQKIIKTKGNIALENRGFMRWESPILGINYKGKVTPLIPGCEVVWTFIDENGKVIENNKIATTSDGYPAPTLAPLQPHANSAVARTCEDCHTNPKTIGYGYAKSRSAEILEGDKPVFTNMAEGKLGDIPNSKTAKPQIPKVPDFPYSWDQLVTRSGKQVQNMPLLRDRPMNKKERDKTEREGTCIACHKYYSSPIWEKIRKKMKATAKSDGKALTPEAHDEVMEEILKAFVNTK